MKISQDVAEMAAGMGISEKEAIEIGMAEKALEFRETGAQIYR